MSRRVRFVLPALLVALGGCLSLPPPDAATKTVVGARAPDFSLPRTGPLPGRLSLADLTSGTAAVLVFYRGHW